VPIFLAPLGAVGPSEPSGPPLLSLPNVGGLWRLAAEATANARVALVQSAAAWSTANRRPVLVDRLAAKKGASPADREAALKPTLTAVLAASTPISFVYDSFRSGVEGGDGIALSYPAGGRMTTDEPLAALLQSAFTGSLLPPPAVEAPKVQPPATPPR
jgi:hypothetical protein